MIMHPLPLETPRLILTDDNYYACVTDIELSERVTDALDAETVFPHSTIQERLIAARWRANWYSTGRTKK
jgi:hypothetical protein